MRRSTLKEPLRQRVASFSKHQLGVDRVRKCVPQLLNWDFAELVLDRSPIAACPHLSVLSCHSPPHDLAGRFKGSLVAEARISMARCPMLSWLRFCGVFEFPAAGCRPTGI